MSVKSSHPWPRLSDSLPGPRTLEHCQACGQVAEGILWQECDENDQPESIYVRLCKPCGEKVIDPHPRLYRQLDRGAPAPGAMPCCQGCRHLERLRCKSPQLKANGGPGLGITVHQVGFACNRGKGGRCRPIYDGNPECQGREPVEHAAGQGTPPETAMRKEKL